MKKILTLISILFLLSACGTDKNIMSDQPGFNKKDHHFVSDSYESIMTDIENLKPDVYYFGFGACPVCQDIVPVFEDVLTELDQEAIYVDVSKEEFKKIADRFQAFDQELGANLASQGAVPFVLVIDEDETIRTHRGTVNTYNAGEEEMNENEIEYLENKLKQAITGQ